MFAYDLTSDPPKHRPLFEMVSAALFSLRYGQQGADCTTLVCVMLDLFISYCTDPA
jgi:hypothetical protein